jgi:hypothetical protein
MPVETISVYLTDEEDKLWVKKKADIRKKCRDLIKAECNVDGKQQDIGA